jgi:Carboxypeptidase regulatory-like domain
VRAVIALAVVAVLATACTDHKDAGPAPKPAATSSTTLADYTGVVLPGVGGETTTTIDDTGTARLVGTVSGPSGPLAGATVRIDRLVAGREIRHDVITASDGRWELRGVPGGRYRVRAFQAPAYAQAGAEVRFVNDGGETKFDLRVEDQRGVLARADIAPDQPLVGSAVNLVVLVVQRTVSPDGIVRSTPVANTFVELTGLGRWVVRDDRSTTETTETTLLPGETTSTTSGGGDTSDQGVVLSDAGRARFELQCVRPGAPGLRLRIPVLVVADPAPPGTGTTTAAPAPTTEEVALEVPACVDPQATTTTTTPP